MPHKASRTPASKLGSLVRMLMIKAVAWAGDRIVEEACVVSAVANNTTLGSLEQGLEQGHLAKH